MPRHTLPELIVVRNEEIENRQMCQKSVLLKSKMLTARAMLEVDYPARQLLVLIKGAQAREYLNGLRQNILEILQRLNLKYTELIRLPGATRQDEQRGMRGLLFGQEDWADFHQLENHRKMGIRQFISSNGVYDVSQLIDLYGSPRSEGGDVINIHQHNQTIIDSTIHGNATNAEKISNSFNTQLANPEVGVTLKSLLVAIQKLSSQVPTAQAENMAELKDAALQLAAESRKSKPKREWYQASLSGIVDAAKKLDAVATPVIELAEKLQRLLGFS